MAKIDLEGWRIKQQNQITHTLLIPKPVVALDTPHFPVCSNDVMTPGPGSTLKSSPSVCDWFRGGWSLSPLAVDQESHGPVPAVRYEVYFFLFFFFFFFLGLRS